MTSRIDADYLVVGAGAMGMAFTDALIDHAPDVRVALVDRRHGVGGHWLEAYPFVQLHQSSSFYGVASTLLGGGRVQERGPEAGLHERANQSEILAYYADVLADRLLASGRVEFFPGSSYQGDRSVVSRVSGRVFAIPDHCRVVDARYLAPDIPAELPPRFAVEDGARVVPVNDLVHLQEAPSQYVVVGSGKTATDACVWLLGRGVDPDAICWVRPREPWMLNRALIQPNPVVFLGMVASMMEAAGSAASPDDLFLRLEDAGIMLRIDRSVTPTMARTPTLATWELDLLRSLENVVRLGHIRSVTRGRIDLEHGSVVDRRRRAGRELRRRGPEDAAARPPLAARRHHPPADPGRLPVLRRRPGRLRRGHPHRRRHQERRVPPLAVPEHPDAVGPDERPGLPELRRRSTPNPTSRTGPTASHSTPPASRPSTRGRQNWTASWSGSRPMRRPGWRDSPS